MGGVGDMVILIIMDFAAGRRPPLGGFMLFGATAH